MSDFLPDVEYEADPNTISVNYRGHEIPWYLGTRSFEIAREKHGIEPEEILSDPAELTGESSVADGIESIRLLVWAGFLVFDADLEPSDLELSFPPHPELIQPIKEYVQRLVDDQIDVASGKAGAAPN